MARFNITDFDTKDPALLASFVGEVILSKGQEGDELDPEVQAQWWGDFTLELAQFMGSAWGYGMIGNDPLRHARYGLLGEAETWPEPFDGGVPPFWDTVHDAFTRKFGVAE